MFLFGNTTQFKQVEAATSDMLIGPDWAANMEIWDAIQRSHDGGKDYLKAMEKRMGHKNPHVVDLTLELLGSCVKNCGGRFHQHVHAQSFLNSLVRVSRRSAPGGNEQAVRDKALVMIMAWAEAFERIRGFPNFATTYNKLRQAGVQFPARDMNEMAPVFTPERTVEERTQQPQPLPAGAQQQQQQPQQFQRLPPEAYHPFSSVTPAYIDKVKGELRQVMEYVGIVQDMLLAADSPETAAREDSLQQLIQTLREVQSRLIRILVEVNDDKLVDVVVSVNEHVGVVLQWHRAVMEGHEFTVPELPPPAGLASDAPAVPESGGAEAKADGEEAPAPSDEFQNLALERHNEAGDEDAADGADKAFDDLAAGGAAPAGAAAAAAAPAHRKTPSQELEELLGLSGPGDASGAGGEVNVSEKEFEDLLGLTDNNSGAAEPGAAPDQADPAILDDL